MIFSNFILYNYANRRAPGPYTRFIHPFSKFAWKPALHYRYCV